MSFRSKKTFRLFFFFFHSALMSENNTANNNIIIKKNQICKDAIVSELQKKKVHLFYCLECEEIARNIAAESDNITLQSINWRSFADGFPNLFIKNAQASLRGWKRKVM
ncbi:hypothetical protein Bca4012_016951 [Brassica carinata]